MKTIGQITVLFLIMVLNAIYSGYVLSILWLWFIVPTFNLPSLNIPIAIGIIYILRLILSDDTDNDVKRTFDEKVRWALIMAILKPSLFWFAGWIAYQFT